MGLLFQDQIGKLKKSKITVAQNSYFYYSRSVAASNRPLWQKYITKHWVIYILSISCMCRTKMLRIIYLGNSLYISIQAIEKATALQLQHVKEGAK